MAQAAVTAGGVILRARANGISGRLKADESPVTDADEAAERIIANRLDAAFPDIPVIGEESVSAGRRAAPAGLFFLVDPLDGTREFLAGRDEFTVNVALVADASPAAGVVYAPVSGELWVGDILEGAPRAWAGRAHAGVTAVSFATLRPLAQGVGRSIAPTALVSRMHADARTKAFLDAAGVRDVRAVGSSVKFCRLAEGSALVYPRFGRTMEWDTAAGDAVLRAVGGVTLDLAGRPLVYGKPSLENGDFIAWARPPAA